MKINCPKCGTEINPAVALGKKGLGVSRNFTPQQIKAAKKRLASINKTVTPEQKAAAAKLGWEKRRKVK